MAVPKEERLKQEKQTSYSFQNFSTWYDRMPKLWRIQIISPRM